MFNSKEERIEAEKMNNVVNIIGKGTLLNGDLETYGNISVDGKVQGNVKTKSKIVIGQTSQVEGNIYAQHAEVAGEVKGRIEVSEILVLKPSAVIHGDIITNKLIVESGAKFNGGCKMGVKINEIKIGEAGSNGIKNEQHKVPA